MISISLIRGLQVLLICGWLIPLWLFRASMWRVVRRCPGNFDTVRAGVFITALSVIVFPARWLIYPGGMTALDPAALPLWAGAYMWALFASQFLTWAVWEATTRGPR